VRSADVRDNTLTRADIAGGVLPHDADIFVSSTGLVPTTSPNPTGLNEFSFTLPRNNKIAIEFFAGELGVDCGGGQGQVAMFIDGAFQGGTLTRVPASADAGAVHLVTNEFLNAGVHTLTTREYCETGVYGPTVEAKRVTWTVNMLAR
jgi:hypothetical protein